MNFVRIAGMTLYATAFCVILPISLMVWARSLDQHVSLPSGVAAVMRPLGITLLVSSLMLWLWAVHALWRHGGGLPMNAFPPTRPVTQGPFAIFSHPIYIAFGMACFGAAAYAGSAAGLWIVSPTAILAAAALVFGYEDAALFARFPSLVRRPWVRLSGDADSVQGAPSMRERSMTFMLCLIPWGLVHLAVSRLVPDPSGSSTAARVGTELHASTFWLLGSVPLAAAMIPLAACSAPRLRRFTIDAIIAGLLVEFLSLTLGDLGLTVQSHHGAAAVALAVVCVGGTLAEWPVVGVAAVVWLVALCAACVTSGVPVLVVVAALSVGYVSITRAWWMARALRVAERWGDSWKAWRIGPMRIINHAPIAGIAAATGLFIMCSLTEAGVMAWILAAALTGLVGAAAWGWFWVGSVGRIGAGKMRPFGYFGSVIGCSITLACAGFSRGVDVAWILLGSLAMAAPWVQAIGRGRCIINGCCHGKPSSLPWAVRCVQPQSRIVRLSGLGGVPIHPTPVYSMLVNVAIGLLTIKVWRTGAAPNMVCAAYLITAGLARFVEESLRGEPHTPVYAGLRLYQWCAAAMVPIGIALSMAPCHAVFDPWRPSFEGGVAAILGGIVYAIAMGTDLPESNRPLSRLA